MPRSHRRADLALTIALLPVLSAACLFSPAPAHAQHAPRAPLSTVPPAQPDRPVDSFAPLFTAAASRAADAAPAPQADPRVEVMRSRDVSIDMPALLSLVTFDPATGAAQRVHDGITLNLFDDAVLPVALARVEPGVPGVAGSFVLVGSIVGQPDSRVFISRNADMLYIDVRSPGLPGAPGGRASASYEVRPGAVAPDAQDPAAPRQAALHTVRQIDRSKLLPCGDGPDQLVGDPAAIGANPELSQRNLGDPVGPVIDVLVVYTPNAAGSVAGGAPGLETQIAAWVSYANNAYRASGVSQRVRLVHTQMTTYTETNSANTDLSRLAGNGDGFMDEVHGVRETYGADIVHLISLSTGICGLAYIMLNVNTAFASSAFGLSLPSCGADTFAHELGHNMGCAHDHDNGNAGAYCYSFGYRTLSPVYRTIMAYEPGARIDFFSNPDLTYQGQVIGLSGVNCPAGAADNARTLRNTGATVAAFRSTVVPNPPPAAFSLTSPAAGAVGVALTPTFTWQASANSTEYGVYLSTSPDLSNPVWFRKDVEVESAGVPSGVLSNATQYYWGVSATGLGTQTSSTPTVQSFRTRPIGDFNGDGFVGATDLSILLGSWGPCPAQPAPCAADLNGDGFVNSADLALLLGGWG